MEIRYKGKCGNVYISVCMHTKGGQVNVKVITESCSVDRLWSSICNYNQDLFIFGRTLHIQLYLLK